MFFVIILPITKKAYLNYFTKNIFFTVINIIIIFLPYALFLTKCPTKLTDFDLLYLKSNFNFCLMVSV